MFYIGSVHEVRMLENWEFWPPALCTLSVLSTDPSSCVCTLPATPPVDGGNYCVLKTEGWWRAVLIGTVSDVRACKLYSLFTTYNLQNTVARLRIGLDLTFKFMNEKSIPDPPHHLPMRTYALAPTPLPPRTLPYVFASGRTYFLDAPTGTGCLVRMRLGIRWLDTFLPKNTLHYRNVLQRIDAQTSRVLERRLT